MGGLGDKLTGQDHFNNGDWGVMKHTGFCDHLDTLSHQLYSESFEEHINMQLFMMHEIKYLFLIHCRKEFPQAHPNYLKLLLLLGCGGKCGY